MRNNIVHVGADQLTYEIRGIVAVAKKIEAKGQRIFWENIGDPIAKGEHIPDWIREIISDTVMNNPLSFGYSPTKGVLATREFLASQRNHEAGIKITAEDILFFNGLGDAIAHIYAGLNRDVRVIGPDPAYSTHSSAEAAHSGFAHITYKLDPFNGWCPDLADMRSKIEANPAIGGILIINPDNPTGLIYPRNVLEAIVALAREFGLFIISDEIYANIAYGDEPMVQLAEVIGDVPGIALKGLSKEVPWPGSRCGWAEFYNTDKDENFARYVKSLVDAKMLEVCATTLPQIVLPAILGDARFPDHLKARAAIFKARAQKAYDILKDIPEIIINKPQGSFYITVRFRDGVLKSTQSLPVENSEVLAEISGLVPSDEGIIKNSATGALDKRFVYYLLASTGICVVPLSSFNSSRLGFRMTLLENQEQTFEKIFLTVKNAINSYVKS